MTRGGQGIEFRILGSLEARRGDELLALGGAKQRAVLAVLLLHADEMVSIDRLVDEVWGDDPPPSAAHTLESYVSRLRQLFTGSGPLLVRRGPGYALELGGAALDVSGFLDLHERASLAAAMEQYAHVVELTRAALAMWRGPALADVGLASAGRAEADRLEEARLRTFELRFDAELALGRHPTVIGELQALVAQNPYRERFVAQLMLALYRCGRQADALEVYERLRVSLDADLGLQPSADVQRLSGQIVRQERALDWTEAPEPARGAASGGASRTRRLAELVLVGAGVAAAMAFTASGSTPRVPAVVDEPDRSRVAFVVPSAPGSITPDDPRMLYSFHAFRTSSHAWKQDTEIFVVDEVAPAPGDLAGALDRLRVGGFDLVLVLGGGQGARAIARDVVRGAKGTHFAFVDTSLRALGLRGAPNALAIRFAEEESSELAGYLSALMPPRGQPPRARADVVSVVADEPSASTRRLVRAFARGVHRVRPKTKVHVGYSNDVVDPTACELLANEQIDRGSDVVYAIAGQCSAGALATAQIRGVWGIRREEDGAPNGAHVLATTTKYWEGVVMDTLNDLELETLESGDRVVGLEQDYAVSIVGTSSTEPIWSKIVRLCSDIRRHSTHEPEPTNGILDN